VRFFNESRVFVGAAQLGMAVGAYERALEYAKQRKAFGKPIIDHQAIQFKLADMWKDIEAARLLVYKAAWLIDKGKSYIRSSADIRRIRLQQRVRHREILQRCQSWDNV